MYLLISIYVALLLLFWIVVRFLTSLLTNVLRGLGDDDSTANRPVDPFINGVFYAVSYWSEKGGRPYQEDRHQEIKGMGEEDSSLYGVYDGHGGFRAAQYCKDHLLNYVLKDPDFTSNPATALKNAFFRTNEEFSSIAKARGMNDGTTAVTAVIHAGRVYVANAGDSRAIVVQKGGKSKFMSVDHKPNREDEEKRIRNLGGKIIHWGRWRVQGVLAVSRAIGDVTLQPYVTSEPEILEKDIGPEDEFLVLASDGLWDVMRNEDVARQVLSSKSFLTVAKELCSEALIMGSTDNVTALVVDLRNRFRRPTQPPAQ